MKRWIIFQIILPLPPSLLQPVHTNLINRNNASNYLAYQPLLHTCIHGEWISSGSRQSLEHWVSRSATWHAADLIV